MKLSQGLLMSALLGVATVLAGCSSEPTGTFGALRQEVRNTLNRNKAAPETIATLRAKLTPERLALIGKPVLITELPKQKIAAVVAQTADNGGHTTWIAGDNVGIYTKAGMLTGTRGIGSDLMFSQIDGPLSIVTGTGNGLAPRVMKYLDGNNQVVTHVYECSYVRSGNDVFETCVRDDKDTAGTTDRLAEETEQKTIENSYFVDRSGRIQSSRQWVGESNGYMLIEGPIWGG